MRQHPGGLAAARAVARLCALQRFPDVLNQPAAFSDRRTQFNNRYPGSNSCN